MDRLTKVSQFIPVNTTYKGSQLADLYLSRICQIAMLSKSYCQINYARLPDLTINN
jgi:hypothetical protein